MDDPETSRTDPLQEADDLAEAAIRYMAGADGHIVPSDLDSLARHIVWPRPPSQVYDRFNYDLAWACMLQALSVLSENSVFSQQARALIDSAAGDSNLLGPALQLAVYCLMLGYAIREDEARGVLRLPPR